MRTWVVYTLEDPRGGGVRYVGVTHQKTRTRLAGHMSRARKERRYHLTAWVGSLLDAGVEPVLKVVESGTGADWAEAEVRWIHRYREMGFDLTNATDGGEGCPGHSVSPEAREKIAAAHRGKPLSAEHRAKVAAGNRGKKISPEAIAKTAASWRGRKHRPESREKMAAARRGRPGYKPTPEILLKRSEAIKAALARKRETDWKPSRAPFTPESLERIAAAHRGKKHTLEARAKMSAAKRRRILEDASS